MAVLLIWLQLAHLVCNSNFNLASLMYGRHISLYLCSQPKGILCFSIRRWEECRMTCRPSSCQSIDLNAGEYCLFKKRYDMMDLCSGSLLGHCVSDAIPVARLHQFCGYKSNQVSTILRWVKLEVLSVMLSICCLECCI